MYECNSKFGDKRNCSRLAGVIAWRTEEKEEVLSLTAQRKNEKIKGKRGTDYLLFLSFLFLLFPSFHWLLLLLPFSIFFFPYFWFSCTSLLFFFFLSLNLFCTYDYSSLLFAYIWWVFIEVRRCEWIKLVSWDLILFSN